MKTGFFLVAALVELAAAQPHRHIHQHLHEKRNVVTEISIVTATAPDVVVYVNQYGDPVETSYVNHASTTEEAVTYPSATGTGWTWPTDASFYWPGHSASATVETSAAATETASETEAVSTTEAASTTVASTTKQAASTKSSSSAASSSSSSSSSGDRLGLTYSPYTSSGDCKTQSQVTSDFESFSAYSTVRIYGTDCNQVTTVGTAAIANDMKLIAGIYDISDIASEVALIAAFAAATSWSHFDTISVGNELVNSGQATASEVVVAISTARVLLTAAGYTGPVVTVDTWTATIANPSLCDASDYAAVNAHAFFDSDATAATAGEFVAGFVAKVAAACSGKTVVVTESGWPSAGDSNGSAVPSAADQETAIASIKGAFSENLVLFSAFNDDWKSDFSGSFGAEHYWGIYGNAATS